MTSQDIPIWDPEIRETDRVQLLDDMRAKCPVALSDKLGLSVFSHADVVTIAEDPLRFSSKRERAGSNLAADNRAIPLELDPPEHTQFREMLRPLFSNASIGRMEPRIRALAQRDVSALVAEGTVDVIKTFSGPFPVRVLCMFVGWHEDDWRMIKARSDAVRTAMIDGNDELLARAFDQWTDYITPVLENRQKNPRDDAATWLQQQMVDGRPVTRQEVVRIIRLALVAGHGTTSASLAQVIAYLADNPAEQAALRENPRDLQAAIEEILRWSGPLSVMERTALCPAKIGDTAIEKGQRIALMYSAANRDEAVFPDAHLCKLDRKPKDSLLFGAGPHKCLGASLARLELRVAVSELLAQTRSFELVEQPITDPLSWPTREFESLIVRFEAV